MSEIPGDWSLAALLLFGAMFTALTVGAAIFLAESWFQKMRQRREHFKIWQDRQLKIWQQEQRESFLRLGRDQHRSNDNENNSQILLLHERVIDFRSKGIGDQTADDALRDIQRKSRQADSRLSGFNHYKRKRIRFCNILKEVYSHLPNIAQTAGIVVTNPTTRGDDGCQFWAGKLDFLHAKVSLSSSEPSNDGNRALVGEPCVTDSNIPVIVRR